MLKGLLASVFASFLFGALYYLAPALAPLNGEQIFGWRVLVTFPFTTLLLMYRREFSEVVGLVRRAVHHPRLLLALLFSAAMLGGQLWFFLWAPLHGRALAASLGYFLLPLIMVLVGRVLFREQLSTGQKLASMLAAIGVLHEVWAAGGVSWETWFVAIGYTVYFVLRRRVGTDHFGGHWMDMALLTPVAAWYVLQSDPPSLHLVAENVHLWYLIPVLGVMSAMALALYMMAARLLPLGLFGLLSYLEPVLLAIVALLLGERIVGAQWFTYGPIFAAVIVLVADSVRRLRAGR